MDPVAHAIALWARERPDLDTSGTEVVARVLVLASRFSAAIESTVRPFGLHPRAYSMLAVLRTHGAPEHRLTPKQLASATFLTSGGVTNLLDRLERDELVTRHPDPFDGRGVLVQLTARGLELVDRVAPEVGRTERALLEGLRPTERERIAALLGRLLGSDSP